MIKYSDNGNEESKSIEYNSAGYPIKIILSKSEVIQYEY